MSIFVCLLISELEPKLEDIVELEPEREKIKFPITK